MDTMLHGHLHYRCAIDLESLHENRNDWQDLVKRVRSWVAAVAGVDERGLAKPWFYLGDHWGAGCPSAFSLETCQAGCAPESDVPINWACRIEHPCRQHKSCRWRTDITITTVSSKLFRLVLINQRFVRSNYVGEEPAAPDPSVPNFIQILLKAKSWKCSAGSESLNPKPVIARVGCFDLVKKTLQDSDRGCPIVYVSRDFETKEPLIDASFLARYLAGTAVVYVAENSEADKETEALFQKDFRCWGGMVRVYQPRVDFSDPRDARRHRFFTTKMIQELGSDEVMLQIVRACCRRAYLLRPGDIASVEDVYAKKRMERLRELAGERQVEDTELNKLIESVQEDNDKYQKEIEHLRQEVEFLTGQVAERDDRLRAKEHEFEAYQQATQDAYARRDELETRCQALAALKELPRDLLGALKLIGRLHAGRVVVLDDALKSAETANFEDRSLPDAWECLWGMATVLYDLFFLPDQPQNKESAFKDATGFELTLSEGRQTNRDRRFAKMRTRQFNGKTIDITPHVKSGNKPPKCLRVHFYVDHESKRLVIGHCGDHLDTYTTRKR